MPKAKKGFNNSKKKKKQGITAWKKEREKEQKKLFDGKNISTLSAFSDYYTGEKKDSELVQALSRFNDLAPGICPKNSEDAGHIIDELICFTSGDQHDVNKGDQYGDGDQSIIDVKNGDFSRFRAVQELILQLQSTGGDAYHQFQCNSMSQFAFDCIMGNIEEVERQILQTEEGSKERHKLLEFRETRMRFSPLLLTFFFHSKNEQWRLNLESNALAMVELLLKYGAAPDAKIITGATCCTYGTGLAAELQADEISLQMTIYCIDAARSSKFFGKRVVLRNLQDEEMNGREGILGGYICEGGNRQVLLDGTEVHQLFQPQNIFSKTESGTEICIFDSSLNLLDSLNRFRMSCLSMMINNNKVDIVRWLVEQKASIDIKFDDHESDRSIREQIFIPLSEDIKAAKVLRNYAVEMNGSEKTTHQQASSTERFHLVSPPLLDWEDERAAKYMFGSMLSKEEFVHGTYRRPDGIGIDEMFWIKTGFSTVKFGENTMIFCYDKTLKCVIPILLTDPLYDEICEVLLTQKVSRSLVCHFLASFDNEGNCRLYLDTATVMAW